MLAQSEMIRIDGINEAKRMERAHPTVAPSSMRSVSSAAFRSVKSSTKAGLLLIPSLPCRSAPPYGSVVPKMLFLERLHGS